VPQSVSKIKLMLSQKKNEGHLILSSAFLSLKYRALLALSLEIMNSCKSEIYSMNSRIIQHKSFLKSILKFAVLFPFINMDNSEIMFANQILNHPFFL